MVLNHLTALSLLIGGFFVLSLNGCATSQPKRDEVSLGEMIFEIPVSKTGSRGIENASARSSYAPKNDFLPFSGNPLNETYETSSRLTLKADVPVGSSLSEKEIKDTFSLNQKSVSQCQLRFGNVSSTTKVEVHFTVGSAGKVKNAVVVSSSEKNASLENCVLSALNSWKFPLPRNHGTVKIAYPFLLKPSKESPSDF